MKFSYDTRVVRPYIPIHASFPARVRTSMREFWLSGFDFNLNTSTHFGVGSAIRLGEYLKELNFRRVAIIIDSGVQRTDYCQEILGSVEEKEFEMVKTWVYELDAEPDYDSLDKTKRVFVGENSDPLVDCFVGIGGGSVIDFAKGLATLAVNPGPALGYRGFPKNLKPSLPTIAVPTTAGTGSEVTYNAVFIDWHAKKKLGINTMYNFPILAVLDPKLTLTCPKSVAVSAGVDALVHALESYAARQSNSLTKILSREAFKLMFNNLPKVLGDPKDMVTRANLQLGAYLSGISLMNSGSGPSGALSYPLGVHFRVPHGCAGGVFLPHVIKFNVERGYDYSELYLLIENADKPKGKAEANHILVKRLFRLCDTLGIPSSLRSLGVDESNISKLLKEVENLDKAFAQNPIPFKVDDGRQLLMRMM